jgi:hypothetical protein
LELHLLEQRKGLAPEVQPFLMLIQRLVKSN